MFTLEWGDGWGGFGVAEEAQSSDRWQWQLDPDIGYTVRGAYQLLMTTIDLVIMDDAVHLIWHPRVPLKVSVFSWRLLRD
ncbi:cysteine-rich receptor-like protein kinase, partial [Trifolium pratense]